MTFVEAVCQYLEKKKALKNIDSNALQKMYAERSDLSFDEFVLEEDLVERDDLLEAIGDYYKVPAIDVEGLFFEHHLVTMFPKDVMLRNVFIPYEHDGEVLIVIAAHPQDQYLPEIIGKFVSYDVTFMVGLAEDIIDAVEEFYDESIIEIELDRDFEEEQDEEYDKETKLNE